jgi:site-specific DNA-cytosine methylase
MSLILKRDMRHTFIDLYAGCGGFSLGFIQAGMKCIAAVEYAGDAALTYWHNLCMYGFSSLITDDRNDKVFMKAVERFKDNPETLNFLFPEPPDDYWTSSPDPSPALSLWWYDILKLEPEHIMERFGFSPGELGVIVGGPPCQGFSTSGQRNFNDKRNQHPFRYMYFVEKMQPRYFLMENVPGLLTLGKKKGEKEGPFPQWIKEAGENAGYHVEYEIHDCADYGVPQRRRRVVFSGTRKDIYQKSGAFKMSAPTHTYNYFDYVDQGETGQLELFDSKVPPPGEPHVTVFEAIGDLNSIKLSTSRSKDLIAENVPFGDLRRVGHDADDVVEHKGAYYYKDRFNGIYFTSNPVDEVSEYMTGKMPHYKRCPECRKFNLKVRIKCWSCKASI